MPMKRIRTIKPEFFTSEDITAMPIAQRLTFIGLMFYVDDFGNENAKSTLIKAAVWPEDDDITTEVIDGHLLDLATHGQIEFYKVGRREYLRIVNWKKHQRVDKPSPSNVPKPPEPPLATSGREPVASASQEPLAREGKGESGGGSVSEGEREGADRDEGGGRGEEGTPRATPDYSTTTTRLPSPFCPLHREGGTTTPCRACGNARLARKQAEEAVYAAAHQPPPEQPRVRFAPEPDVFDEHWHDE